MTTIQTLCSLAQTLPTQPRIDSSGQVYIGATSGLLGKVSVRTTGTNDTLLHLATTGGGSSNNGDATNSIRFTGGTNLRWANAKYEAFDHIFHGNGVEHMRIDYTGRLLVGTSSSRAVVAGDNTSLLVEGTSYPEAGIGAVLNSNNIDGPSLNLAKHVAHLTAQIQLFKAMIS